jgi:hypothetical protein
LLCPRSTVCGFAPTTKEEIVIYGNRLAIAGFLVLAVAMVAALLTVTSFLFGKNIGIATAASFSVVVAGLSYVLPLWTKLEDVRRARRVR